MSAHTTADDDRRTADQSPTTVRLGDLAARADDVANDDDTDFDNLSEVLREGVRRIVEGYEARERLDDDVDVDVAPNLDGVTERAADRHPMRADGGERA